MLCIALFNEWFESHTDEHAMCQIWELMVYEFKLGHNDAGATKNSCCGKGEITGDYSIVNTWFKKFHLFCTWEPGNNR